MTQPEPKQVIVLRRGIGMSAGKATAQGAHASVAAVAHKAFIRVENGKPYVMIPSDEALERWLINERFTKIVLSVETEAELKTLYERAVAAGLRTSYIVDEGLTEFNNVPTATAISIGPDYPERVDPITGNLPLYK